MAGTTLVRDSGRSNSNGSISPAHSIVLDPATKQKVMDGYRQHLDCLRSRKDAHPRFAGTIEHAEGKIELSVDTHGHSIYLKAFEGSKQLWRVILAKKDDRNIIELIDNLDKQLPISSSSTPATEYAKA